MRKTLAVAGAFAALSLAAGPALAAGSGIDRPTDGQSFPSGSTIDLWAHTDLDPARIQWAVRNGMCGATTTTVAGNVDGKRDTSSFDQATDQFRASVAGLSDGNYCFIFNVNNGAVRELHDFTLAPTVLANKDECKDGGFARSQAPVFKNQGECVSSFASAK